MKAGRPYWPLLCAALATTASAQDLSTPPAPPEVEPDAGHADAPVAQLSEPVDAGTPSLSVVIFKDGQRLTGAVVQRSSGSVVLRLGSGQLLTLDESAIEGIEDDSAHHITGSGKTWFEDPNRTRYFFSPSAVMLKRGEAHFSQKELAISSFAYGVLDYLSLELSSAIPAFFAGTNGINVLLSVKAGAQLSDDLWLAVGTQALSLPGLFNSSTGSGIPVGGIYFGSVTLDRRDWQLTLSAGMPYFLKPPNLFYPIITLSASVRVTEMLALMSENWFFIGLNPLGNGLDDQWVLAQLLGVRLMGQHFATDLGVLLIEDKRGFDPLPFPVPWVDFTYNF